MEDKKYTAEEIAGMTFEQQQEVKKRDAERVQELAQDKAEFFQKATLQANEDDNKEVVIDSKIGQVMSGSQTFNSLVQIPAIVCPECNASIQFAFSMKHPITGNPILIASCQTAGCEHTQTI